MLDSLTGIDIALMIGAFVASGLMRGFNGGAGANFITAPVLAAIIGPRDTVPIVLGLNFLSNFQLFPGALPYVNWREALPLGLAAGAAIPFGVWILFAVDQDVMRRAVAATAVLFALLIMSGWRYRGPRGTLVSLAFGGVAGTIGGAVTIGGPPVFLYLLSGNQNPATNRANFIAFGFILQVVAVVTFALNGAITRDLLLIGLMLFVPFLVSVKLGSMLFKRVNERLFRNVSLGFMLVVAIGIMVM